MTDREPQSTISINDVVSGHYPDMLHTGFPLEECMNTFRLLGPDSVIKDRSGNSIRSEYIESPLGRAALGANNRSVISFQDCDDNERYFKIDSVSRS